MAKDDFFILNKFVTAEIDARVEKFLKQKVAQAGKIDPLFQSLLEETERVARLGGKRLRPTLAVVGYRAAGGKNDDLVLDAAVALELLHVFMCVHDDIMDRDDQRHGGLNITGRYKEILNGLEDESERTHVSQSMSLLAGDLLLTFVYEVIGMLGVSAETRLQLMERVHTTCFDTVGGQQLDVLYPFEGELSVERLLRIPYHKTSIYTFVSPLLFGAMLAGGVNSRVYDSLYKYGEKLGITFQIIDDILGIFGASETTGKSTISDIRDNKPTILRHYAFELSNAAQLEVLRSSFGKVSASNNDLAAVKKAMTENGARSRAYELAEDYATQAKSAITSLKADAPLQHAQLVALADFCLTRDH